jgi:hypothetical protein
VSTAAPTRSEKPATPAAPPTRRVAPARDTRRIIVNVSRIALPIAVLLI